VSCEAEHAEGDGHTDIRAERAAYRREEDIAQATVRAKQVSLLELYQEGLVDGEEGGEVDEDLRDLVRSQDLLQRVQVVLRVHEASERERERDASG
jgi:hypothetical protein